MGNYRTTPGSMSDGVDLILDHVSMVLNFEPTEYNLGMRDGFIASLESLLSAHGRSASEILQGFLMDITRSDEEADKTRQFLATPPGPRSWVLVTTIYGGHDSHVQVSGPYNKQELEVQLANLSGSGYELTEISQDIVFDDGSEVISVTEISRH